MRIVYSLLGYKPAWNLGGPILSVSKTAERLVQRGHHVTVVATNSNHTEDLDVPTDQPVEVDGVEVWYFRREEPIQKWFGFVPYLSQSLGFFYCPKMRGCLDGIVSAADVVDTQMPFVYPTFATARAALRNGKALFYHQRGNFLPSHLSFRKWKKELYIRLAERPVLKRATCLIALTETEQDAFRRWVSTPSVVIPNGIDIPPLADENAARRRVREQWGIPESSPVLLFLGRLHPWKGADLLLDAFLGLRDEFPDAVLVVAGPDEWGLEEQWKDRAAKDGGGRVLFPGVVAGEPKSDLLARADLFCLPSKGEGFSMAVLEAMANQTAVMLSPECSFPIAESMGAGLIVSRDVESMVAALRRLLSEPERLRKMAVTARQLVSERYSWDTVIDQLLDVYERGRIHGGIGGMR